MTDTRRARRRRAILDAACDVFFEKGFGAATLTDVITRSGGSLKTLYELFGSKDGLFAALVDERCAAMAQALNGVVLANLNLADALRAAAHCLLNGFADPSAVALLRIVIAECSRQPELSHKFYNAGPATYRRLIAEYLELQVTRGNLDIEDAQATADDFVFLLLGDHQMRLICGLPVTTKPAETSCHVERTVKVFMQIHARRPPCLSRSLGG